MLGMDLVGNGPERRVDQFERVNGENETALSSRDGKRRVRNAHLPTKITRGGEDLIGQFDLFPSPVVRLSTSDVPKPMPSTRMDDF
jgi:hypothetical protein